MIAFYSIRKLIEAKKVASKTEKLQIALTRYPWKGKLVTLHNWHRLDELYEFDQPVDEQRELTWICNQIIHSYVFSIAFSDKDKDKLDGIMFSSDYERNRNLYYIGIDTVIKVLEYIGKDYPHKEYTDLNPDTGDYDVVSFSQHEFNPQ